MTKARQHPNNCLSAYSLQKKDIGVESLKRSEAITIARSSRWLEGQSTAFQEALFAKCRLLSFSKGEYVLHMGDPADEFFLLVDGIVLISAAHPVLGQVQGQVVHPGHWFGEPAALGQRRRLASVLVRRPSKVLAFPVMPMFEILHSNPSYATALLGLMANTAEEHMLHAVDLLIQSPRARLCSRLLTFAGRRLNAMPPINVIIPLSQDELALTSCMSRQTVNQILGELVEKGICQLHYGEIEILDTCALARFVD